MFEKLRMIDEESGHISDAPITTTGWGFRGPTYCRTSCFQPRLKECW